MEVKFASCLEEVRSHPVKNVLNLANSWKEDKNRMLNLVL